jgi:hypothetical protein
MPGSDGAIRQYIKHEATDKLYGFNRHDFEPVSVLAIPYQFAISLTGYSGP